MQNDQNDPAISSDESSETNPCCPIDGPKCPEYDLCFSAIAHECGRPDRLCAGGLEDALGKALDATFDAMSKPRRFIKPEFKADVFEIEPEQEETK